MEVRVIVSLSRLGYPDKKSASWSNTQYVNCREHSIRREKWTRSGMSLTHLKDFRDGMDQSVSINSSLEDVKVIFSRPTSLVHGTFDWKRCKAG